MSAETDRMYRTLMDAVEDRIGRMATPGQALTEIRLCSLCEQSVAGWIGTDPGQHLVVVDHGPLTETRAYFPADGDTTVRVTLTLELQVCATLPR